MAGWQRVPTDDLDNLSARQYHEIANAHDAAGWEAQRQGFTELRDLADDLSRRCERALAELRRDWSGGGAEAFAAEFGKIIDLFASLRDSAATNADGMREVAAVIESTRGDVERLSAEDKAWESNPDGDDEPTVAAMREGVRGDLRDRVKDADESFQHLAQSYLLDPPEPLRLGGMETVALDPGETPQRTVTATSGSSEAVVPPSGDSSAPSAMSEGPSLQNAPAHHGPAPVAEPAPTAAPVAEPAPASGPMMPMGGMGMGGPAPVDSGGGTARADGPLQREGRPVPPSRMRSNASRQELLNQSRYGPRQRPDPNRERRAVDAETDSPFAPTDVPVVPPVISGGVTDSGPHDSGPVLTGTVYRHFPEYGQAEPDNVIAEEYEDGSSAQIQFDDDEPELAAPPRKPAAIVRAEAAEAELETRLFNTRVDGEEYLRIYQSLPREKARQFAAAQQKLRLSDKDEPAAEAKPGTEPRNQTSLDELRRLRQERRRARRRESDR